MIADRKKVEPLLKTARGQIDGILRMIEEGRYCIDISNQLLATIAIMNKANKEILKAHMEGCVRTAVEQQDVEQKIEEIVQILEKVMK